MITKYSKFVQSEEEDQLPSNVFFRYRQKKKLSPAVDISNPLPMRVLSRDVVIVVVNYNETENIFKLLRQTTTIMDRIWLFVAVS